eukprot:1808742-Prymnesium_polylepis.1
MHPTCILREKRPEKFPHVLAAVSLRQLRSVHKLDGHSTRANMSQNERTQPPLVGGSECGHA